MRPFGRFRLRLLAHGLVLMVLMAAAVAIADRVFVNRWVESELTERRPRVNRAVSLFGPEGNLVGTRAEPPVDGPSRDVLARLAQGADPIVQNNVIMTGLFRDGAFVGVVARRIPGPLESYPGPPLPLVLLTLVVCIAATLLISIPLSRAVVRPVETLARSVKRFGAGELGARALVSQRDEIGDLATAFNDMASRIESLVRKEKRLLADISHELRTPLARIRVVLELASDGEPERTVSYLGEIAQDLAELESLVDDILASARLASASGRVDGGGVPMHWTKTSVAAIADKSRLRFERLHPGQRFEVKADVGALEIDCDPALLHRAIDNLLDNAAKYAAGASVVLEVIQEAEGVAFNVVDDGPGMSAEAAARAFEPFFREDVSRDRRTGGVGLGLSIVRTIVAAHGGRVGVDSAPGRGTKVAIVLPLHSAHQPA
jgi:two-component system OmpR family sensor kinase